MSCGPFKCGLRRFDGHGVSSYRPSNTEATRQLNSCYEAMMVERSKQDLGIFQVITTKIDNSKISEPVFQQPIISKTDTKTDYYLLSDSKKTF